jgi:hypothetical protein
MKTTLKYLAIIAAAGALTTGAFAQTSTDQKAGAGASASPAASGSATIQSDKKATSGTATTGTSAGSATAGTKAGAATKPSVKDKAGNEGN